MTGLVPNAFLFDFEFPLRYRAASPALNGKLCNWESTYELPCFGLLDQPHRVGRVWACWNENGIGIGCEVTDRKGLLSCDPEAFWKGDNLRLCTDMRDTRDIHRATRHCQQFFFMPAGAGKHKSTPVAASAPLNRARESAPPVPAGRIPVVSEVDRAHRSYHLDAFIRTEDLAGFDPIEHPRIGLFYILEDTVKGQQPLTIGDDLQWHVDPSTWATAALTKD